MQDLFKGGVLKLVAMVGLPWVLIAYILYSVFSGGVTSAAQGAAQHYRETRDYISTVSNFLYLDCIRKAQDEIQVNSCNRVLNGTFHVAD